MPLFTPNANIPYPAIGEGSYAALVNALFTYLDGLSAVGALAVSAKENPSTSLNVKVSAGSFRNASGTVVNYAGTASQAVTNTATNYLYLTNTGTLTVNTTGFPTATDIVTLALVTAAAGLITGVADARVSYFTAQR